MSQWADGDTPSQRICQPCISKHGLSNQAKHKQAQEFLQPGVSKKKKSSESAGGGKLMAPPPYSDLSLAFGLLEEKAGSAGNTEAVHFLRRAKMSFLAAYAAKLVRQTDIRAFTES